MTNDCESKAVAAVSEICRHFGIQNWEQIGMETVPNFLHFLTVEITLQRDELRQRLAEAREDTARLDWWINHSAYTLHKIAGEYAMVYGDSEMGEWHTDPRAAIDKARGKK